MTANVQPVPRARGGFGWRRTRQLLGLVYAAPTAVYVAVFFVLPLLLVLRMSASDWTLLAGDAWHQPPGQLRLDHRRPAVLAGRLCSRSSTPCSSRSC